MPVPKNKSELLKAIQSEFEKLQKEIVSFPIEKSLEKSFDGHKKGSYMSFHNLLSYLLGWGKLVLKWNEKIKKNQEIDWPESGFKWTELGELAQKFYQDYAHLSLTDLKEELNLNHSNICALIKTNTNDQLYSIEWYKNYPMGRMIQLNTSSPYKNARLRIRKWKKSNSIKFIN